LYDNHVFDSVDQWLKDNSSSHVAGRRPECLYIRKIHYNTFIYTLLIYNTPVSGANEIGFVVINHFLI